MYRWSMRSERRDVPDLLLILRARSRANTMTGRKKVQVMLNVGAASEWWRKGSQRGKGLITVITVCKIVPVFLRAIDTVCRPFPRIPSSPLYMHESANFLRGRTPVRKTNRRLCVQLYACSSPLKRRVVKWQENRGEKECNVQSICTDEILFEHIRVQSR